MIHITRPTLLLDRQACLSNISKMVEKADKHDLQLIPHFKTHQSAEVGNWFRESGIKAITVTSVKMASYFAKSGWKNITIAFPVNILEITAIEELAKEVDLKIFLNSKEVAKYLCEQLKTPLKFYIEIDTGDGRSGIHPDKLSEISEILNLTRSTDIDFEGFYTHAGHTYHATSKDEVKKTGTDVVETLRSLKTAHVQEYPDLKLALGDTPSTSLMESFDEIDSIHPGNFVYYDLVQYCLGANTLDEIAICLAAPVVSVFPERQEVVVHSGWVHQGKDSLQEKNGEVHYGLVVRLMDDKWSAPIPRARVKKLSQEHGVLTLPKSMIEEVKVGDVLGILPVHACATAFMMGELFTLEGKKIEMMPIP